MCLGKNAEPLLLDSSLSTKPLEAAEAALECFAEKNQGGVPDEASVFKLMYLAINNISKRWNRPVKDWKAALSRFAILFPDRFPY